MTTPTGTRTYTARRRALGALACVLALVACDTGGATTTTLSATTSAPALTSTSVATTTSTQASSTTTVEVVTTVAPTTTTMAPTTTTTRATTTTAEAVPNFSYATSAVTANDLSASWRPGCPVPVEDLAALDVSHWGYDEKVHTGRLIVAAGLVKDMAAIMEDLFAARFPIERMEPVDVYGGDDDRSMAANNTSAFNCRAVTGGSSWSEHSYGRAIDVNPLVNPYVIGSRVLPPEGAKYANRSLDAPGMVHGGDVVVDAFAARGWGWGGYWDSPTDYQHFSTTGH